MTAPCVSSDAISHALALGHHELALEWADQRSCLGWRHILYFQSSFSQVAAVDPELAEKLTALASELFDSPPQPSVVDSSTEAKLNVRHATCAAYWKGAVSKARKLPGLGRFLAPTTFTEIQSAVDGLGGPVVYFNLNRFSCDALCVIPKADEVVHIPLPCLSIEVLEANSPRSAPIRRPYVGFPQVLEHLWDWVVKPVLDGLAITSNSAEKLPRIWWCPSGLLEMFPLHAAGLYQDGNGDNIMNYVVSSYIPSSDLISHVTRDQKTPKPKPRFLTVANPTGCGLPGTDVELETIRKHLTNAGPITELTRASATPDAVKQELQTATWAHFACHGVQVEVEDINGPGPTSCLFLANYTRLTLLEISKLKLPQAQLAFLSACDTAQERPACTGESVHIAAGMLVAGFRSVIGTMWKISDEYAPELADLFYQKMFEGVHAHGQVPDYRRSAYALHDAVKALRQRGVDFKVWVPFLHYGA
ncbi:hypothetical protein BDN72DRAFT_769974 [Pluteus cervinus]|uniref:Uncharacterized protein n=1 Tax=Pluteus cervinus TaxID=181527 RepID=A0ACD3ARQ7_9AGAR|nr:hypothetical protein BDN72DRAFT_769974 [Pluteus cervinus]